MPCGKHLKGHALHKYLGIRTIDVGRPGHHYIRVGIKTKKGKRGGRTEMIGGLKKHKR